MKSVVKASSKDIASVRTVSSPYSNFFFIILEFINQIQLILFININKLMVLIYR